MKFTSITQSMVSKGVVAEVLAVIAKSCNTQSTLLNQHRSLEKDKQLYTSSLLSVIMTMFVY